MNWLVPTATIVVSVIVAVLQYAQWRTANQKVVIDLYDRRLRAFTQIEKAIQAVLREGEVSSNDFYEFSVGQTEARFLFGEDVRDYLQELRGHLAWLVSFRNDVIDQSSERQRLIDEKFDRLATVLQFFERSPAIFAPYLNLTQKSTPFWRPW